MIYNIIYEHATTNCLFVVQHGHWCFISKRSYCSSRPTTNLSASQHLVKMLHYTYEYSAYAYIGGATENIYCSGALQNY